MRSMYSYLILDSAPSQNYDAPRNKQNPLTLHLVEGMYNKSYTCMMHFVLGLVLIVFVGSLSDIILQILGDAHHSHPCWHSNVHIINYHPH